MTSRPISLRVDQEGDVARVAGQVAEGRLVRADDEVARLLELNGEEEGGRDVLPARRRRQAASAPHDVDLARPEGLARGVGLAVEEVVVVLADEGRGVVYRVGVRRRSRRCR